MDSTVLQLLKNSEALFSKRTGLISLWQVIAENCFVERADFTTSMIDGGSYAEHLFGSYPLLARRELGNLIASNLRPRGLTWFSQHVTDEDVDQSQAARAYLEYISKVQWRAMYDPASQFVNATKQADHDFAAFGNAVIELSLNNKRDALLFQNHHLKDCVWSENDERRIDTLYRKWAPTARNLAARYPDKVSKNTNDLVRTAPETTVECCQIVVPERTYKGDKYKAGPNGQPRWTVIYVEKQEQKVLEESQEGWFRYVIPRWQQISGTQYARSPATEIILPDARTFQVVTRTLREAGEMHVNPPMVGSMNALRSDVQLYPGGFTAVDEEFDGELKNAIAPIDSNPGTMPVGFEILQALRDDIRLGFFLDKIKLPDVDTHAMTAYEVQKRLEEHIRAASPLFEPIEDEYNAPLCDLAFEILSSVKAFGPDDQIPQELSGARLEFRFRSPLRDIQDQAKAGLFGDILQRILIPAAQVDPAQMEQIDLTAAVRDALTGVQTPAKWLKDIKKVAEAQATLEQQKQAQVGINATTAAGQAAEAVGKGGQAIMPLVNGAGAQ